MNLKLFIFILIILCLSIYVYFKTTHPDMTYEKSDIDDVYYLVRNTEDKQAASNTLAKMRNNLLKLSNYLYQNKDNEKYKKYSEYITRLYNKMPSIIILESTHNSIYTSYSVNKGEQIIFCIRINKQGNIHDINLMMYVALHEISHVACPIYDNHGPLFKEIFAFITHAAIDIDIYKKIDFNKHSENYCGMQISDSII
jgi:hypothetical protein